MREQRLLWVDLETTGLDPMRCLLLEVGLLLTDDRGLELAATSVVLGYPDVRHRVREPVVRDMHDARGLFDEVERSRVQLPEAGSTRTTRAGCSWQARAWAASTGRGLGSTCRAWPRCGTTGPST